MSKEEDFILAGLTDEERAIMAEPDDPDEKTATVGDLEDKGEPVKTTAQKEADADDADEEDEDTDGDADGATAAADADAAKAGDAGTDAPAGAADAGTAEPGPAASAPIYVAEAPADAEVKLAAIATQKAELRAKHDDGDITTDELMTQTDALNKQERDIERAVDKAAIAAEMEQQRQKNEWLNTANKFAADHGYSTNPRLYRALDAEVRDLAVTDAGRTMTGPQILAQAHANLVEAGLVQAKSTPAAAAPKQKIPKPALPPNLGGMPAAGGNDPGEGRFASLDRLQSTNPGAYEAALAKLSPAELDAYLAA